MLYDLASVIYNRLAGKSDVASTDEVSALLRSKPGDINAIADAVDQDINRIHRPIIYNSTTINVYGGTNNIVTLNQSTYDYAKTKILGSDIEEFFCHVTSLNGNTIQGRFWIEEEERSVGFSVNKKTLLKNSEKKLLSWSLDQWVNQLEGSIFIQGYPLRSKQGILKHVFVTHVESA